jgi:hypothetical protein
LIVGKYRTAVCLIGVLTNWPIFKAFNESATLSAQWLAETAYITTDKASIAFLVILGERLHISYSHGS